VWLARAKKVLLLLAFLGVLSLLGGSLYLLKRNPYFRLSKIEIEIVPTKRVLSRGEIIKLSGLVLGQNIFEIDLSALRKRLELHPWVEKAFVARKLPHTVYLRVFEEEPVAMVSTGKEVWLVNARGRLFAKARTSFMKELPALAGISKEELQARRLHSSRLPVLKLLAYLKKKEGLVPPYANLSQLKFLDEGFELLTRDALRVRFWGKSFKEFLKAYRKLDRIVVYLYETRQYQRVKAVRLDYPEDKAALVFKSLS